MKVICPALTPKPFTFQLWAQRRRRAHSPLLPGRSHLGREGPRGWHPPHPLFLETLPIASFLHPGGALQVKGKGNLNGVQREGMLSLGKWKVEPGWRNLVLTVPVCSLDSKQETPVKCLVSKAGKKPTKSNTASKP